HPPTPHKSIKTEKEILEGMKQRRKEEVTARKFFLPFETATNYLRIQVALLENRLDKRGYYNDLVEIFSEHWQIFDLLDTRQSNIFLYLIPILYDLRDNCEAAETIMGMIFLLPVTVRLRPRGRTRPDDVIVSRLGENRLSIDLTTGNMEYDEGADE